MNKEFVTYEQALELKELGFDEPCLALYDREGDFHIFKNESQFKSDTNASLAPTFSQGFRFFREKYGLFTSIIVDQTTKPKFYYNISEYYEDETTWEWKDGWGNSSLYRTYEEAELACLDKLIEIVKRDKSISHQKVIKAACDWVDENGHKWSNNTNEVGDNYGSFMAGAAWYQEQLKKK